MKSQVSGRDVMTSGERSQTVVSQDVERWKRELEAAGWNAASATAWYAPDGGLYRGPYGAWKELQRRRGVLIATDADEAKAREIIGNVNNYAEDDGELSISAFGPLSTRIAEALATVRKEEREAAFKEAIAIIVGQPTAHYIYSGAYPMTTDTFRDNAVKAIEATIAIERARAENRKGEG